MAYDYSNIPPLTKGALDRYVENRLRPGDFTYLLLCNDVLGAISKADPDNQEALYDTLRYIQMELPSACCGSPEKVSAWLENRT